MDRSNDEKIKKKAAGIITKAINKGSENVTTLSKDPTVKYEAPDYLDPESTILED